MCYELRQDTYYPLLYTGLIQEDKYYDRKSVDLDVKHQMKTNNP